MIPKQTHAVLANGFGHLGSANASLKSTHTDTMSTKVQDQTNTITCFVLSFLAEPVLNNLRTNGRVSFYAALPSHEAYQFKGQFLGTCQLTEEDLFQSEKFRNAAMDVLHSMFGIPAEPLTKMFGTPPDTGVTFKVEKIFKQTPGPEAGQELNFG